VTKSEQLLEELYATVMGECPSLLDEDSGGDSVLGLAIEETLKEARQRDQEEWKRERK
jgi:hypothetical protein